MSSSEMIQIENLCRTYHLVDDGQITGSQRLFAGLSMRIMEGEFVSVVGPSGSGKSTLLNIIGGLDSIQDRQMVKIYDAKQQKKSEIATTEGSGKVSVAGEDITQLKGNQRADFMNRNIGFIFQSHHLIPELSAGENVALPLEIRGISARKARQRARQLLKKMDLERGINKRPAILSGGEKQRVSIARALANNPKVLLADEPTGSLQPALKQEILDIFVNLNREEGLTVLMVSHDVDLLLDQNGQPRRGRLFDLGKHQERFLANMEAAS